MEKIKLSTSEYLWQIVMFWAIIFTAVEAPLSFALKFESRQWQLWIDGVVSIIFLFDLLQSIKEKKQFEDGYLVFIFAVIACFPFEIIAFPFRETAYFQLIRLFRLVRLVQIVKIFNLMKSVAILPRYLKLQFIVVWSIILTHWIACGWLIVNQYMPDGDLTTAYNKAFYWSVTTLTTIGYGDITPTSNIGRFYTMVIMILGVAIYSIVIGNVAKIMTMADRYKEKSREKINDITLFMKHYNIPQRIQREVFSFYNHLFTKRLSDNDSKIISELPHALQSELQIYMNLKLISGVPVFQFCSPPCLKMIAASLEQIYFSPGQRIIHLGETGREMFIIGHGIVEVMNKDGKTIATLQEGQFFGEAALIQETVRNADVRAKTYCDLYRLSKDDFLLVVEKFPQLLDDMVNVMKRRGTDSG